MNVNDSNIIFFAEYMHQNKIYRVNYIMTLNHILQRQLWTLIFKNFLEEGASIKVNAY